MWLWGLKWGWRLQKNDDDACEISFCTREEDEGENTTVEDELFEHPISEEVGHCSLQLWGGHCWLRTNVVEHVPTYCVIHDVQESVVLKVEVMKTPALMRLQNSYCF